MKTIRIKKETLKKKLKENLAKHDEIYEEALENYWKSVSKSFAKKVAKIEQQIENREMTYSGISISIHINSPENNEESYHNALSMLEYEVDDVVELTQDEFNAYVLNKWQWANQFLTSNAMYSAKATDIHAFHG